MGLQRGVVTGCKGPNTNLKVLTRKVQSIKNKYADQPATNCNTLPQSCVASVEQPWMDITVFKKSILCICILYMQDALCSVIKGICNWPFECGILKVANSMFVYNTYTQFIYNRAFYTCSRVRTCTGSPSTHCVHGLATGLQLNSLLAVIHLMKVCKLDCK
jgi:hypothetical protein